MKRFHENVRIVPGSYVWFADDHPSTTWIEPDTPILFSAELIGKSNDSVTWELRGPGYGKLVPGPYGKGPIRVTTGYEDKQRRKKILFDGEKEEDTSFLCLGALVPKHSAVNSEVPKANSERKPPAITWYIEKAENGIWLKSHLRSVLAKYLVIRVPVATEILEDSGDVKLFCMGNLVESGDNYFIT